MDARLLPQSEFDNVHFFRTFTLLILLVLGALTLTRLTAGVMPLFSPVPLVLLALGGRFVVEWRRLAGCQPAFIDNDELVLCGLQSHRQIPLRNIQSVRTRRSLFMVRRYRSWSEHLAFLEFTLNDGERVATLAESGVLEFPAGAGTLKAVEAAILAAKMKGAAGGQH
ncbi:hypothetical protein [Pseudomonas sp. SCB32]|uniref:hypothetical protein n=1 Tax=Pseudomonas sp. SCB32 TaxID=2653853 RepID=UPI0012656A1F|nr:hypothetical protein [Pseudomonas sp. SCB32]